MVGEDIGPTVDQRRQVVAVDGPEFALGHLLAESLDTRQRDVAVVAAVPEPHRSVDLVCGEPPRLAQQSELGGDPRLQAVDCRASHEAGRPVDLPDRSTSDRIVPVDRHQSTCLYIPHSNVSTNVNGFVRTVDSGERRQQVDRVVDQIADGAVDCVVVDHEPPDAEGIELLEAIRAEQPDLPVVLRTGNGSEKLANDAIAAGVSAYLHTDTVGKLVDRVVGLVESYRVDRERIFEDGYSTSQDGTGLGLSIVDEIVDAHGWTITVAEGSDGGARFEIAGVETVD